jgi:hypothetical protein
MGSGEVGEASHFSLVTLMPTSLPQTLDFHCEENTIEQKQQLCYPAISP